MSIEVCRAYLRQRGFEDRTLFLVFLKGFNNTNYSGGGEKKQERSWKDGCHMV